MSLSLPKDRYGVFATLIGLYVMQAIPIYLFGAAIPVILRERGVDLATIGSMALLFLPWVLKFLWAPYVDRWKPSFLGPRKGWIIPSQILICGLIFWMSLIDPTTQLLQIFIIACVISFLARLPGLVELHKVSDLNQPLQAFLTASLVTGIFFAPIFFYVLAAISHLIAKLVGGQGTSQSARLALFWSLIAMQPLLILTQTLGTLIGPNMVTQMMSFVAGAFFLWVWITGIRVTSSQNA